MIINDHNRKVYLIKLEVTWFMLITQANNLVWNQGSENNASNVNMFNGICQFK